MNSIIKRQLNKVREAVVPPFNDDTTSLIISRNIPSLEDIKQNKYYQISIEDYIINEPENFTLSSNWNGGTKPIDKQMNVEILTIMGKMIKITGVGVNDGKTWEGWLPRKAFKVIKEL